MQSGSAPDQAPQRPEKRPADEATAGPSTTLLPLSNALTKKAKIDNADAMMPGGPAVAKRNQRKGRRSTGIPVGRPVNWLDTLLLALYFSDGFVENVEKFADLPELKTCPIYAHIVAYLQEARGDEWRMDNYPLVRLLKEEQMITDTDTPPEDPDCPPLNPLSILYDIVCCLEEFVPANAPLTSLYRIEVQWAYRCRLCHVEHHDRATVEFFWNVDHDAIHLAITEAGKAERPVSTKMLYKYAEHGFSNCRRCFHTGGTAERSVHCLEHGRNLIMTLPPDQAELPLEGLVISQSFVGRLGYRSTIRFDLKSVIFKYPAQQASAAYHLCSIVTNREGDRYYVDDDIVEPVDSFEVTNIPKREGYGAPYPIAFFYTTIMQPRLGDDE